MDIVQPKKFYVSAKNDEGNVETIAASTSILKFSPGLQGMVEDFGATQDRPLPIEHCSTTTLKTLFGIAKLGHTNLWYLKYKLPVSQLVKCIECANFFAFSDDILASFGNRISRILKHGRTVLSPDDYESINTLPVDFQKHFVTPVIMKPVIDHIKTTILQKYGNSRKSFFSAQTQIANTGIFFNNNKSVIIGKNSTFSDNNSALEMYTEKGQLLTSFEDAGHHDDNALSLAAYKDKLLAVGFGQGSQDTLVIWNFSDPKDPKKCVLKQKKNRCKTRCI